MEIMMMCNEIAIVSALVQVHFPLWVYLLGGRGRPGGC